jgi:hypothetical protein
MKKVKRPIALFVALAFVALLQVAAMPLRADQAPAATVSSNEEQAPAFVEHAVARSVAPKKKSMVPYILIGVGAIAVAAVLVLVVFKTKYDLRGSWTVVRSSDFYWIQNPRTFVFEGSSRDSGTMKVSGFNDVGPWSADGKSFNFTMTVNAASYLWTFEGQFDGKDTISGTVNYHDASHNIDGTFTATRAAAAMVAPLPTLASEALIDR